MRYRKKTTTNSTASPIFQNVVVSFPKVVGELTPKRIEILKERIEERKGRVIVSKESKLIKDNALSVYVICSSVTEEEFRKGMNFVKVEWLTECLKNNELISPNNYILSPFKKSEKNDSTKIDDTQSDTGNVKIIEEIIKPAKRAAKTVEVETDSPPIKILNTEISPQDLTDEPVFIRKQEIEENELLFSSIWTKITRTESKQDKIWNEENEDEDPKNLSPSVDLHGTLLEGILSRGKEDQGFETAEFSRDAYLVDSISNIIDRKAEKELDEKKETFLCGMPKGTYTNYNKKITNELEKLEHLYQIHQDKGRVYFSQSYRRTINMIKTYPRKISSIQDVDRVYGLSANMKEKVIEILTTGTLQRIQHMQSNERFQALREFMRIWGVGPSTANKLFNSGFRSVEDVRNSNFLLTEAQKIGLKYIDEFSERIPRAEVAQIIEEVRSAALSIIPSDILELTCCGSYRRGKDFCGDADIILTLKEGSTTGLVGQIVKKLEDKGFFTDSLSKTVKKSLHGSESYMGVCRLSEKHLHRRIDIKVYPREQYGFALLYFTGSDMFNRSMRLFAKKKGFSLSDYGLFPAIHINNEKVWAGQTVPCYREEDVFKFLHLNYKEPKDREV